MGGWAAALAQGTADALRAAGDLAAARRACALARPAELRAVAPLVIGDAETAAALAAAPAAAAHGLDFLDHALVASGADGATLVGRAWAWLERFGDGSGPGWTPAVAGPRACRLAAAAAGLAADPATDPRRRRRLARAVRAHALFLAARWRHAPTPVGRVDAAAGLTLAALADARGGALLARGVAALGDSAAAAIDAGGGVATRNPDDLAAIFAALAWTADALEEAGAVPDPRHAAALGRAGPALRALRLGDGGLARFHGGRGGGEAALDEAFARAGARARGPRLERAMGYERLSAGPVVALVDAAAPPPGPRGAASALALEISVGRTRLAGGIGCGAALGGEWALAARATAAHAALEIDGASSARLEPESPTTRRRGRALAAAARAIDTERLRDENGQWLRARHDGYLDRFGLAVVRRLHLSPDGAMFSGEDAVEAPDPDARRRFDRAAREGALPFLVRFHLPPTAVVETLGASAARIELGDGARWTMIAIGDPLRVEESVWIAPGASAPAPTRQLVILGLARAYWGRVGWRLEREAVAHPARRDRSSVVASG